MNFKTTYVLFGLLAVMFGVLAVVLYLNPSPGAAEKVFPSMHQVDSKVEPKAIEKATIERKVPSGSTIVLTRVDDNTWKITEPRELAAESGVINNLVQSILDASIDEQSTPSSLKAGGLDNPTRVITLHGKDKEWTLTVGEVTP